MSPQPSPVRHATVPPKSRAPKRSTMPYPVIIIMPKEESPGRETKKRSIDDARSLTVKGGRPRAATCTCS